MLLTLPKGRKELLLVQTSNRVSRMMGFSGLLLLSTVICGLLSSLGAKGHQPLAKIAIHRAAMAIHDAAYVKASPALLGVKGQSSQWVDVEFHHPYPSNDDWIAVFSPAKFNSSVCEPVSGREEPPLLCTSPIKFQNANYTNAKYSITGKGSLKFQLINQRADFSFALFSGGLSNPKLVSVSEPISFANPKAPVYPRLAQGKVWNEMAVTWTSGYDIDEAEPFVEWGLHGGEKLRTPAGTLTFDRLSLCGSPARTVGWRDPGFIHTSFLKELWPNAMYTYKLGHRLYNGSHVWSESYRFRASPYPGQNSVQRVIIFGDMGKGEPDGSNEYENFQFGSLNTTNQLIKDLKKFDMVLNIGDLCYANGYISQWDRYTSQIEPIASAVPFMVGSGNHERDWPDSGSFYGNKDSGGECGVLAETMFYVPAENRAKFWYATDFGMFRFCIADTEHDWRPGTEQHQFIEHCLSSVDRQKQPWLIFLAHRVLGYSSTDFYADTGSYGEPMGKESIQELLQKYKVDIAFYGHAHNYERTCPVYQNTCVQNGSNHYGGPFQGTTHIVVGGGGASLANFAPNPPKWSYFRDMDYGFVKLTAFNHSTMLLEYKKSSNGKVYDHLTITRDYRDILACSFDSCPKTTLAT